MQMVQFLLMTIRVTLDMTFIYKDSLHVYTTGDTDETSMQKPCIMSSI